EGHTARCVERIASGFSDLDISVFSQEDMKVIRSLLKGRGFPRGFTRHFSMDSYSNIRNMCFAAAMLKKADIVVQIDDDEVIEDPGFMKNAAHSIGKAVSGNRLLAKTGIYINSEGSWRIKQENPVIREMWLKETAINQALESSVLSGKKLAEITVAFGGNMVIHRDLFASIPYDPYNTRGEDTDYLVNCMHFGYRFLLDTELRVKHIPPRRAAPYWAKMRQDIFRFMYLREKIRAFGMDPSGLDPYPGAFLREDLEERVRCTCNNYAMMCREERHIAEAREWEKNCTSILESARRKASRYSRAYPKFQKDWERFMKILE
ncbi:MAG: hypothetical protein KAT35_00085, partial [Candidatus Aenigmarchaeota archaeon]|nr:hypothetical protein [Candidatus Aenigmarchaeota archaeon]